MNKTLIDLPIESVHLDEFRSWLANSPGMKVHFCLRNKHKSAHEIYKATQTHPEGIFLDFWISVPLTHHYKKCPVMWTITELISKNPEISLSSRNNPEMSQCSSDVPMLVNFSIYIFPSYLL